MAVATMRKYVPLILPWFLPSAMFSVVVAAVHSWKTDSLQFAFLFVVLPLVIWTVTIRSCSKELRDPVFAPSFVSAVVFTDIITFGAILRPAISVGLEVAFVLGTVNLLVLYWRVIQSDPGRFPVLSSWNGAQGSVFDPRSDSSPRLDGWTAEDFEGEPLKAKDPDVENQAVEKLESNEEEAENVVQVPNEYSLQRLPVRSRYCRKCNAWIDHFDHHCPAIKNCVGRKNHVLFLGALIAFIVAEVLYIECCYKYIEFRNLLSLAKDQFTTPVGLQGLENFWFIACQVMSAVPWVTSSAVFAAFQVSWQIPLLLFHVYCASVNLTTAEWIKWERFSDLHIEMPLSPDQPFRIKKFVNPYDQGVLINLKQFLQSRV